MEVLVIVTIMMIINVQTTVNCGAALERLEGQGKAATSLLLHLMVEVEEECHC